MVLDPAVVYPDPGRAPFGGVEGSLGTKRCGDAALLDIPPRPGTIHVTDQRSPQGREIRWKRELEKVKLVHERDPADAWGRVRMPNAPDRKYPNAPKDWLRQWLFPQTNRWTNSKTKGQDCHHVEESLVQKSVRDAVARSVLTKRATCHTFLHAFATHLLEAVYDIRTIQQAPGAQRRQDKDDLHPRSQSGPLGRSQPGGRTLTRRFLCRSA